VKSGIDPCVDYVFKKLYGSEDTALLLVSLLNAVVGPTRPVTGVQIVLPQADKAFAEDKLTIGDVKARDQGNRQFQLEMQWQVPWFFPKRVLFYWGRFHPQQLREGEHYITLRPTISICFTKQVLFADVDEYHLNFRLREEKHAVEFSDDLEIHLIELPKFNKTSDQLASELDRWCYFLRHGADLDPDTLPASLDVPEIRRALEVLAMFTKDENEREIYELRLKYQRDHDGYIQYLKDAATDAEARGEKKGALMGQVRLCQELLKQSPTPQPELSALDEETLAALLAQLRKQLLTNGS
jgi:predicted transposase/invertase (TIGR01784 family)